MDLVCVSSPCMYVHTIFTTRFLTGVPSRNPFISASFSGVHVSNFQLAGTLKIFILFNVSVCFPNSLLLGLEGIWVIDYLFFFLHAVYTYVYIRGMNKKVHALYEYFFHSTSDYSASHATNTLF